MHPKTQLGGPWTEGHPLTVHRCPLALNHQRVPKHPLTLNVTGVSWQNMHGHSHPSSQHGEDGNLPRPTLTSSSRRQPTSGHRRCVRCLNTGMVDRLAQPDADDPMYRSSIRDDLAPKRESVPFRTRRCRHHQATVRPRCCSLSESIGDPKSRRRNYIAEGRTECSSLPLKLLMAKYIMVR